MQIIAIILTFALIAGFIAYLKLRNRDSHFIKIELDMLGIGAHLAKFTKSYKTPGGVEVESVVEVPSGFLALIDEGIQNQITRHNAAYPNWANHKALSDYKVLIIEPMGTNQVNDPGSPCIFVNGIQTAGTCLGVYPRTKIKKPCILVPHQAGQGWAFPDYFMRSVWYESEHIREYKNLNNEPTGIFYYYATAGDEHPHQP